MEKKINKKTKTMERDRCKTCNCQYRTEIEHMRLIQNRTYKEISDYLMQKYGFGITVKGLSNHFNLCLPKKQQVAEAAAVSEDMITEIRDRKKDLVQIAFDILADLVADKTAMETDLRKIGISRAGRTTVDLMRLLTQETREYIRLITGLLKDSTGVDTADLTARIEKFEEDRKKYGELLDKLASSGGFEVENQYQEYDEDDDDGGEGDA